MNRLLHWERKLFDLNKQFTDAPEQQQCWKQKSNTVPQTNSISVRPTRTRMQPSLYEGELIQTDPQKRKK